MMVNVSETELFVSGKAAKRPSSQVKEGNSKKGIKHAMMETWGISVHKAKQFWFLCFYWVSSMNLDSFYLLLLYFIFSKDYLRSFKNSATWEVVRISSSWFSVFACFYFFEKLQNWWVWRKILFWLVELNCCL